jgi:hypothetical protein
VRNIIGTDDINSLYTKVNTGQINTTKQTGGENNMANNNTGKNRVVVPEAAQALDQFKLEVANEVGLANYANIDKGTLTSRQNGYVGGYMVKHMVEAYERSLAGK